MTLDMNFLEQLPFDESLDVAIPQIVGTESFNLQKTGAAVKLWTGHAEEHFPRELLVKLWEEFNYVVEEGRTYPFCAKFSYEEYMEYLFGGKKFLAILAEEDETTPDSFLGHFYVKPNYVGRSSHVCNGGFVVNHSKRGLGLGKELGRKYLAYAPRLGYVYSVFNLVYETNVASLKIWDSLGFERIGYVKNVAMLKGESSLVGAHIYGKDLTE